MEKQNDIYKPSFEEHDFVATLLPLLKKEGMNEVDVVELSHKLYYYYEKTEYKELFKHMVLKELGLEKGVNIDAGLKQEKYHGGCVSWDMVDASPLLLRYPNGYNFSYYEQSLSEDGKQKIRKISHELACRDKIEKESKYPLFIYGTNPNDTYTVVKGKCYSGRVKFELITDGNVQKIRKVNLEDSFLESPINRREYRLLKEVEAYDITIINASYVLKRGMCGKNICYTKAYTELEQELEMIKDIANAKEEADSFVKVLTWNK